RRSPRCHAAYRDRERAGARCDSGIGGFSLESGCIARARRGGNPAWPHEASRATSQRQYRYVRRARQGSAIMNAGIAPGLSQSVAVHADSKQLPRAGSGAMFDAIADRYDLLNRIISLGVDQRWRRHTVNSLRLRDGDAVLDLATGTGDLALMI